MTEEPKPLSIPDEAEIKGKDFDSAQDALVFLEQCGFPRTEFVIVNDTDIPQDITLNSTTERGQQHRSFAFLTERGNGKFCFTEAGIRFLEVERIIDNQ